MVYCIRWWYICFFRESKFLFRLDVRAINSIDSWQRRPSLVSLLSVRLSSLLHRHSFRACHAIFLPHGGLGDEPKECLRRRLSVGLLIYNSLVTLWSVFPYLVLCPHLNWQRCYCSYSGKGYGRLREISLPFPGSHEVKTYIPAINNWEISRWSKYRLFWLVPGYKICNDDLFLSLVFLLLRLLLRN